MAIGASATVAVCGMLTVALVGYVVVFQSHLGDAKPIGGVVIEWNGAKSIY